MVIVEGIDEITSAGDPELGEEGIRAGDRHALSCACVVIQNRTRAVGASQRQDVGERDGTVGNDIQVIAIIGIELTGSDGYVARAAVDGVIEAGPDPVDAVVVMNMDAV